MVQPGRPAEAGNGDLYCSNSLDAENYILHTMDITVEGITMDATDTLKCYLETSQGEPIIFSETGTAFNNEDHTFSYVLSRDDETSGRIHETTAGVNIPWYLHNCSIERLGSTELSFDINRRIYVHKSRPWSESDLTLAIGCEETYERLFNERDSFIKSLSL